MVSSPFAITTAIAQAPVNSPMNQLGVCPKPYGTSRSLENVASEHVHSKVNYAFQIFF